MIRLRKIYSITAEGVIMTIKDIETTTMNKTEVQPSDQLTEIITDLRNYFKSGQTLGIAFRQKVLDNLQRAIRDMQDEILDALQTDLGKSHFEGYMSELGMALDEIAYMKKHLPKFARPQRVRTPLAQFSAKSYKLPSPYGVVLIISPWNYPFYLTLGPLIDALAAGNVVLIKSSANSPATSRVINKLISRCFNPNYVSVLQGGREANKHLLDQQFDHIFFTGSKQVGKLVMEKASRHLTPVSLELGGKSPCIVDPSANLKIAAARIAFGKFLNVGQTCVAPDYLLVHKDVRDKFLPMLKAEIHKQYGENPLDNPDYGHIINERQFQRLLGLMQGEHIYDGGQHDDKLRIAPTILDNVRLDSPVMQEEIFGPILPVLTFRYLEDAFKIIEANPTPLALYLFSKDKFVQDTITKRVNFGGGCINDTIIHLATTEMGFGGVGQSGMGSYHGKAGFDTFTHYKSMVNKANWIDLNMRYQPYNELKFKLVKMFLK
jgi:aldehyde dehydrogenase (NAD+)